MAIGTTAERFLFAFAVALTARVTLFFLPSGTSISMACGSRGPM